MGTNCLFKVGTFHLNKKGAYLIQDIQNDMAAVEYSDGNQAFLKLDMLKRIELDYTLGCKQCLQPKEALLYLEYHEINTDVSDQYGVVILAHKHIEELHLKRKNNPFIEYLKHLREERIRLRDYLPANDVKSLAAGAFASLNEDEAKRWGIFKSAMTKTSWMKTYLKRKQVDLCPVCDEKLDIKDAVIHHLDYMQLCLYNYTLKHPQYSNQRPYQYRRIANCEKCRDVSNCVSKLALLHQKCHYYLHLVEGRIC